ncbi:MAG: NAD(P)/FAD-dependent oxidoreductase [Actinomycetes bacterium]
MNDLQTFVIAGASLAGAKAAETLREEAFTGRILLVGEEAERPYERPPLSKQYLAGSADRESIFVHAEEWYAEHDVDLLLGTRVTALDREAHEVMLSDGSRERYDKLLLATGSSPLRLRMTGSDAPNVMTLRTVGDSERLREAVSGGGHVVVVGAGWIGLETAAAARTYGAEVTVVEPQPTPLHQVLGPELGEVFATVQRDHGVVLRLGEGVGALRTSGGRVTEVVTSSGDAVPADIVVVGVGIRPNTEIAEAAGLAVDHGVLVDAALRTDDPDVYAAGDVANAFHPVFGERIRVEHWANALNGGPVAARSMLGQDVVYDRVPYFFSDQFDLGMEYSGWAPRGSYDQIVYRGDAAKREFVAFWLQEGRVRAGMNVNVWDVTAPIQAMILSGRQMDPERLADTSSPLADLTA